MSNTRKQPSKGVKKIVPGRLSKKTKGDARKGGIGSKILYHINPFKVP